MFFSHASLYPNLDCKIVSCEEGVSRIDDRLETLLTKYVSFIFINLLVLFYPEAVMFFSYASLYPNLDSKIVSCEEGVKLTHLVLILREGPGTEGRLFDQVKLEASVERMAIQLYQRLEKENKFLLILDDVWEKIDLDSLGVPQPEIHMVQRSY
ncbi:hypothetical protein L1049_020181 [Liquidambar formosana]|uniref:NB-ARC domain-containing protein n=1 Tax=Liquidambar formosana TaxID=63359 RepID=A0AAP0SDL8_LIQFO